MGSELKFMHKPIQLNFAFISFHFTLRYNNEPGWSLLEFHGSVLPQDMFQKKKHLEKFEPQAESEPESLKDEASVFWEEVGVVMTKREDKRRR